MDMVQEVKRERKTKKDEITRIAVQVKSGNFTREEFGRLYDFTVNIAKKAITKRVFNICLSEKETRSRDIASKILGKLDRYDPKYSYDGFAYQSSVYSVIDFYRRNRKLNSNTSIDEQSDDETYYHSPSELISTEPNPHQQLETIDQSLIIQMALEKLTKEDQMLFNLHFKEGKTAEEIASGMDLSVGSVYLRWHRILRKMRLIIEQQLGFTSTDLY